MYTTTQSGSETGNTQNPPLTTEHPDPNHWVNDVDIHRKWYHNYLVYGYDVGDISPESPGPEPFPDVGSDLDPDLKPIYPNQLDQFEHYGLPDWLKSEQASPISPSPQTQRRSQERGQYGDAADLKAGAVSPSHPLPSTRNSLWGTSRQLGTVVAETKTLLPKIPSVTWNANDMTHMSPTKKISARDSPICGRRLAGTGELLVCCRKQLGFYWRIPRKIEIYVVFLYCEIGVTIYIYTCQRAMRWVGSGREARDIHS